MGITLENLTTFIAIFIYLADVDVAINCVFLKILEAPQFASQLMIGSTTKRLLQQSLPVAWLQWSGC